jgi:hypothetical protein
MEMKMHMKLFTKIILFMLLVSKAFCEEFPSVRYVTSKEGLNHREIASVTGKKIGTFLYAERIVVYEKSVATITVDGITDYWYKCSGRGPVGWVFGGYLSEIIPIDIEPVLGYWNTDKGERYYWYFQPDHTVRSGRKETDIGWLGTWTLSESTETPLYMFAEKAYRLLIVTMPTESMTGESQTIEIIVHAINRDRIYLQFTDSNGEFLDRNNGII